MKTIKNKRMKRASKRQKSTTNTTKPKVKKSVKKSSNYLLYGLLAAVITFFVNYLFFINDGDTIFILSKNTVILTSLVLSAIVFYSIFKIDEKQAAIISKYTFLLLLIYGIFVGFIIPDKESTRDFIILYQKLTSFQNILIIPTIVIGIISVWIHKAKLQELINNLYAEKETEKQKISIKERIFNPVKQLFSKKELLSTSVLFVIIGISVFTLFYRLDYFDLYSDEGTTSQGAAGYYHSGEFKFWNFAQDKLLDIEYRRAIPHQFLVAQSYKLFGVSTWSTRFPSVLFGIIFIILGYFIARYFLKDSFSALLIVFSFSLYFEFLLLQRWGRMYAIIFPLFLYLFYLSYRFITEPLPIKYNKFNESSFFNKYLNYNYILLPVLIVFLVLNANLHINTLFFLAIFYLYILLRALIFKEKKYIPAIIIGIFLITAVIINPVLFKLSNITLFESDNYDVYLHFFFGYPFVWKTSLIILVVGVFVLIFSKNKEFVQKYLLLYSSAVFAWIFFGLVIVFSVSFRYMSFLAPLAIFLIIGMFVIVYKVLFNKYIHVVLAVLLVVSVLVQFSARYDNLYVENFVSPAKPSVAWKSIISNYKKGEVIYRHWSPILYFDDIDSSAIIKTIGSGKKHKMSLNTLLDSLKKYPSGWITWQTHNAHVLDPAIIEYCNIYFDKINGYAIDSLGVEIFHYTDSLIVDSTRFKFDRLLPIANLNLANDFSIAFMINSNNATIGSPFYFKKADKDIISVKINPDNKTSLLIDYQTEPQTKLESSISLSGTWHHITIYKNRQQVGLYIDGKLIKTENLNSALTDIVKFRVNTSFNGQLNDIRIYDFVLNQKQIQTVIQNTNNKDSEILLSEGNEFKTLFHWQKQ